MKVLTLSSHIALLLHMGYHKVAHWPVQPPCHLEHDSQPTKISPAVPLYSNIPTKLTRATIATQKTLKPVTTTEVAAPLDGVIVGVAAVVVVLTLMKPLKGAQRTSARSIVATRYHQHPYVCLQ